MTSTYITVFTDALSARLMPAFSETTITAIAKLNPDAYVPHAVCAALGACVAYAILYVIGVRMRRLPERVSTEEQRARIAKLEQPARFWLPYILVLAPTPLGTVLLLAAGFFGIRVWLTALVVVAGEILWRAQHVMQ